MKKIFKYLGITISVIIGLTIAGLLFIQFSPAYNLYFVKSGSMSPAIDPGDLVITGPIGGLFTGDLAEGKVVTFFDGETIITHRILEINDGRIITKGDANEDPDTQTITTSNILGIKLLSIPKLGYINSITSDRKGWFLIIIIPTIILVSLIIKDIVKESLKGSKKEENKQLEGGEHNEGKNEMKDNK